MAEGDQFDAASDYCSARSFAPPCFCITACQPLRCSRCLELVFSPQSFTIRIVAGVT
jgi:hypothetical protein